MSGSNRCTILIAHKQSAPISEFVARQQHNPNPSPKPKSKIQNNQPQNPN
eukprot:m.40716 g.40716  ORF g.40716 m.40716 type:complete len:50 (+) comp11401_c0_seq1:66-215(+)